MTGRERNEWCVHKWFTKTYYRHPCVINNTFSNVSIVFVWYNKYVFTIFVRTINQKNVKNNLSLRCIRDYSEM